MKFKSASSNPRVTSSNLRVTSSNRRVTSSNPQVKSSSLQVTSSNPRIIKSMKTQVSSLKNSSFLKIVSLKLFGNSWGNFYVQFLMITSCFTFPPLHGYGFSKKVSDLPKKGNSNKSRKIEHLHWILHIRISPGTKFQNKVTILIFGTKITQKWYLRSKSEKLKTTTEFCLFK